MTLWAKMFDWIESYIPNRGEAEGLTNQVHYLAQKHAKSSFVKGLILGAVIVLILLRWIS